MRIIRHSHPARATILYMLLMVACIGYVLYKGILSYSQSLFMRHGERVNIVMYGQETAYYSLDTGGGRHYVIYFFPDLKVQVPGGFENYRIGSLGKLAYLEGETDIIQRSLSFATSSLIHATFYPNNEQVYYGKELSEKPRRPYLPYFFSYQSDASVFDRLYIAVLLLGTEDTDFDLVAYRENKSKVHKEDVFFQSDSFAKKSIGLLYQTKYRDERKNIQIRYSSYYQAATTVSSILEGTGIRVSDILRISPDRAPFDCVVTEESEDFSATARDIASYFNCRLKIGKTDIYDVVVVLGKQVEEDWRVK